LRRRPLDDSVGLYEPSCPRAKDPLRRRLLPQCDVGEGSPPRWPLEHP
jgi:hypothetical protein